MSSTENRPSLGQLLKGVREKEAQRQADEIAARAAEAAEREQRLIDQVNDFLNRAYNQFSTDLVQGREPRAISLGRHSYIDGGMASSLRTHQWRIPPSGRWQDGGNGLWTMGGRIGDLWDAFVKSLEVEGLELKWSYQHDGVGMESWWELTVDVIETD